MVAIIASTPKPPYYAVIFTSLSTTSNQNYNETSEKMFCLAARQPGFLGVESAREELGLTVSYWRDLESIKRWKQNLSHLDAQKKGKTQWYSSYKVRISKVDCDYGM